MWISPPSITVMDEGIPSHRYRTSRVNKSTKGFPTVPLENKINKLIFPTRTILFPLVTEMGYVNFCRVRIHILTVKNAGDLPSENMFQLPKFLVMVWPAVVIPNKDLSLPSSYFIATIRSNERTSLPTSHEKLVVTEPLGIIHALLVL